MFAVALEFVVFVKASNMQPQQFPVKNTLFSRSLRNPEECMEVAWTEDRAASISCWQQPSFLVVLSHEGPDGDQFWI